MLVFRKHLLNLLLLLDITAVQSQQLKTFFPTTNGSVTSLSTSGDTLFIGGYFTHLFNENNTGWNGVLFNDTNEQILGSADKPNGPVYSSIADGNGGFFIGGSFSKVGDSLRQNLAHVNQYGKVTSIVDHRPNGPVYALQSTGSKLFVGGSFGILGKRLSTEGAILNALTANVESSKEFTFKGSVYCSEPDGRGGWYVGGNFLYVGDSIRYRIAHIDAYGNLYNWTPEFNGAVYTIRVRGNTVYVGGAFDVVNGSAVPYFVTIDAYDAKQINKQYFLRPDDAVSTIEIQGDVLYLGGYFSKVNNVNHNLAAAIDINTGTLKAWNPQITAGYVLSMAVCGSSMIIGGTFTRVGGQTRNYCASVHLSTANLQSWNPSPDKRVNVVQVKDGKIYLGGEFTLTNNITRNFIASFDTTSSLPTAWNPSSDGPIYDIECFGDHVYIAGNFTKIGLYKRSFLADIRSDDGRLYPWEPLPDGPARSVSFSGLRIFAGGDFNYIGGVSRSNLACIDLKNNRIDDTWRADHDGQILSLCYEKNKELLFTGGGFKKVNDESRSYLAAVSTVKADLSAFDPQCDDTVFTIMKNDSFLFVGGKFEHVGLNGRNKIARFSLVTGLLNTPEYNASGIVYTLLPIGNTLIVGGDFITINNSVRNNMAAVESRTGAVLDWNIDGTNGPVKTFDLDANYVYAAGVFSIAGGEFVNHICRIGISDGIVKPWPVYVNDDVFTLSKFGNSIYAGGRFSKAGGVNRNYLAAMNTTWGNILPLDLKLNGLVKQIYTGEGKLFVTGLFTASDNKNRKFLAGFNLSDMKLLPLSIQLVSGEIRAMYVKDNLLFIGGNFDSLDGQGFSRFACLNLQTGNAVSGLPSVNGLINSLVGDSNYLYVGGTFSNIGGQFFNNLFRLKFINRRADSLWNPNVIGNGCNSLLMSDTLLYIGGNFSNVGTKIRYNLADVSLKTAQVKSLFIDMNSEVFTLARQNRLLLIGGGYDLLTFYFKNYYFATNLINASYLNGWGINPNAKVNVLRTSKALIYHGGDFTYPTNYLAVTDTLAQPCNSGISLRYGKLSFCQGDSTTLSFTPNFKTSYQWLLNGNKIDQATDTLFFAKNGGTYTVRVIDSINACITTSSGVVIKINDAPYPQLLATADTLLICPSDSATVGIDLVYGARYQWYRNNIKLNTDTFNKKYIYDDANYNLYVVGQNGCGSYMKLLTSKLMGKPQPPVIAGKNFPVKGSSFNYKDLNHSNMITKWFVYGGILNGGDVGDSILVSWTNRQDSALVSAFHLHPAGCKSDTTVLNIHVGDSTIQLSDSVKWVSGFGGNIKIGISANLDWGALNIGADWFNVTPSFGADNDSLLVSVKPNRLLFERNAQIAVYSQQLEKYVTIRQMMAPDSLSFSKSDLLYNANNHSDSVRLSCNVRWNLSQPASWLTVQEISDSGNKIIHFNMTTNLSSSPRSTVIQVSTGLKSTVLNLTQSGITGLFQTNRSGDCMFYPNPAKHYIQPENCVSNDFEFDLYDITGKYIARLNRDKMGGRILLPTLHDGFYILQSTDGAINKKVLICNQ